MQYRTRIQIRLVIALIGMLGLLAACGQKGPLYLPPPGDQTQSDTHKDK